MSWAYEEWGEKRGRKPRESADQEDREKERERAREQAKNDHYWARPRDVGSARYAAQGPSLPASQMTIERSTAGADRLAIVVEIAFPASCPRCAMPVTDPGELRVAWSLSERYVIHGTCGGRFKAGQIGKLRLGRPGESPDQIVRGRVP